MQDGRQSSIKTFFHSESIWGMPRSLHYKHHSFPCKEYDSFLSTILTLSCGKDALTVIERVDSLDPFEGTKKLLALQESIIGTKNAIMTFTASHACLTAPWDIAKHKSLGEYLKMFTSHLQNIQVLSGHQPYLPWMQAAMVLENIARGTSKLQMGFKDDIHHLLRTESTDSLTIAKVEAMWNVYHARTSGEQTLQGGTAGVKPPGDMALMTTSSDSSTSNSSKSKGKKLCPTCGNPHKGECNYSNGTCSICNGSGHGPKVCPSNATKGGPVNEAKDVRKK
jgi:hypothetical protein